MGLLRWLQTSQARFSLTQQMALLLLERHYQPVTTAPTGLHHATEWRRDHTAAILERLLTWREPLPALRLFSWGPVYRAYNGTWEDALDVELLEMPWKEALAEIRALVEALVERFPVQPPTRLVLGHTALLRRALLSSGASDTIVDEVLNWLRRGNPAAAEERLEGLRPRLGTLLRPLPLDSFHRLCAQLLGPEWMSPDDREELDGWQDGPWDAVRVDLSLTGRFTYYDGLVFHLYSADWGQECIAGGRYRWTREELPAVAGVGFVIKPEVWQAG